MGAWQSNLPPTTVSVRPDGGALAAGDLERGGDDTRILCAFCGEEARDACLGACGHTFCRHCAAWAMLSGARAGHALCPTCGEHVSEYSARFVANGAPMRRRAVETIFGTTFITLNRPGLFSMSFAADQCFMRFDPHVVAARARTFDDGSAVPPIVHFENWSYDARARRFRGDLDFSPKLLNGAAMHRFELAFDEGFEQIESGTCEMLDADGRVLRSNAYGEGAQLYRRLKRSLFETDSVFVIELPMMWVLDRILDWASWLMSFVFPTSREAMNDEILSNVPVESLGLGSLHFSPNGSFVDYSRAFRMLMQGVAPVAPFIRQSFDADSRTFEGVAQLKVLSGQDRGVVFLFYYRLLFDEALGRVLDGEHRLYQVLVPILPQDVLTQKFSNVAQSQLHFMEERKYGYGPGPRTRYRLMNPWQTSAFPLAQIASAQGAREERTASASAARASA